MRERFKLMSFIRAAAALFGYHKTIEQLAPEPAAHDEFHHQRSKRQLHSAAFIRKHRHARNVRNEMAFQSRKRNRA